MAEFLSQDEIDALLEVCDDEEYEEGSPEFEEVLADMQKEGLRPYGNNPMEVIDDLKRSRKKYIETIKEFEKFEVHYKKIQEIARAQPEMFI